MDRLTTIESFMQHYGENFGVPWLLLKSIALVTSMYTKEQGFFGMMGISREIYANHTGVNFKIHNPECCIEVAASQLAILKNRMADIPDPEHHYAFVLTAYRESVEVVYQAMRKARLCEGLPATYKQWRSAGKPSGKWQCWDYTSTFFPFTEESVTLDYVHKVMKHWQGMS